MGHKKKNSVDQSPKTVIGTVDFTTPLSIRLVDVTVKGKGSTHLDELTVSPSKDIMPKYALYRGTKVCIRMALNIKKSNKGNPHVTQQGKVYSIDHYTSKLEIKDKVRSIAENFDQSGRDEKENIETEIQSITEEPVEEEIEIPIESDEIENKTEEIKIPEHPAPAPSSKKEKAKLSKIYLVDLENYADESLLMSGQGCPENAEIHFFYTNTTFCKRLSLEIFENKKCYIASHKTQTGDQELDKQLVSYLGYLLGKYGKNIEVIIVSRDRGYLSTVNFWKLKGYDNIKQWSRLQ